MESDQTYVELLIHSLQKKNKLLDELIELTKEQEQLLSETTMDIDNFNISIESKGVLIDELNLLNDGFESLYNNIKHEFETNKESYKKEIMILKDLIKVTMEKSVQIQAIEKRNYTKFNIYLNTKKKEIKDFKISTKTATSYYKNMADQHQGQSYFLDKKK